MIWDHVRASVEPIDGVPKPSMDEIDLWLDDVTETAELQPVRISSQITSSTKVTLSKVAPAADIGGMMRSTKRAVAKGHLEPTARIDLHGDHLNVAKTRFESFIIGAAKSNHKIALVITGKGGVVRKSDFGTEISGVIRRALPDWMNAPSMLGLVSHYCPAHIKHGGEGAFYVFIRAKARR